MLKHGNLSSLLLLLMAAALCACQTTTFQIPRCQAGLGRPVAFSNQTDVGIIHWFVHDQNGSVGGVSPTTVHACHDNSTLFLNFTNTDEDVISNLKGCNSALYTEDAVEFFIATEGSYPADYYEFEVSPRGELFFADINNPYLNCSKLNTNYMQCPLVKYGARLTELGWEAWLEVGLKIIGRGQLATKFYGNLYRIDKNAGKPTGYYCWQSTMADPPCFHKPKFFGRIELI